MGVESGSLPALVRDAPAHACLGWQALEDRRDVAEHLPVGTCVDARRGEVYRELSAGVLHDAAQRGVALPEPLDETLGRVVGLDG